MRSDWSTSTDIRCIGPTAPSTPHWWNGAAPNSSSRARTTWSDSFGRTRSPAVVLATDHAVQRRSVEPGTLNVFTGRHILHRVAPVQGPADRVVAVFSYAETDDVVFTTQERIGFYGRS